MNWEKIKTFLIILFLLINIFLISSNAVIQSSTVSISKDTVSDTVNVLTANGFSIDKDIIMLSVDNIQNIEITNILYKDSFLNSIDKKNLQSDGINFSYTITSQINITEKNYEKKIKNILKNIGIDGKNVILSQPIFKNSETIVTASSSIKKYIIFDSMLKIIIKDNNITIQGCWYEADHAPKKSKSKSRDMVYITAVLANLINNPDIGTTNKSIEDINFGFKIQSYDSGVTHKTMSTVPSYEIRFTDGNVFYFNARTGEYLK